MMNQAISSSTASSTTRNQPGIVVNAIYAPRTIALVATLLFLSMVPVTMLVAPLKELVSERYGASSFWTHSFMSVNMIGAILASPLIGILADRHGLRKRVAAWALAADAILLASMAYMPSVMLLFVVRFFEGAAHILVISTLMAIASGWTTDTKRGRTMGMVGASMMFGTACGTRLGGMAFVMFPHWVFQIAGAIAAMTAILTIFFVRESRQHERAESRFHDALGLLRRNPGLWVAFAYAFIDRLCVGVVITTFGLFLADVHGLDPGARSRLMLMFLLPFALLVYPAGRLVDRVGRIWPLAGGSIAFGVLFACYGLVPLKILSTVMVLSGITSAIMFAPNLTLIADLTPQQQRGAAYTGFNVAGSLGFVLGPLFAGGLFAFMSHHGTNQAAYETTFIATGCAEILVALLTLPWLLKMKRANLTR